MKPFSVTFDQADGRVELHTLHDRVLIRLVALSFTPAHGSAYSYSACSERTSFRVAFHAFAEAYFTLALEDGLLCQWPALHEPAVDALAQAFSDAVASGELTPPPASTRLTAAMTLTSLAALQHQVTSGALTPSGAANLLTTVFFEGL